MNILICDPIGQDGIDYFKKNGCAVTFLPEITPAELLEKIPDVEGLVVRGRSKITKEIIERGKKLRVIARSGTGVENIDCDAARDAHIAVVNAPGANSESVAEHVFALLLALTRKIIPTVTKLRAGVWSKSDFRGMELMGKTLGIIGFGNIGKRVAELGRAFGMNILVFTRSEPSIGKLVTLDELVSQSDVVSVHVPLTMETRDLIGPKQFSAMKNSAYFINTSRGAVIVESALINALVRRTIAGAALDVFTTEPLPHDSPLLRLSNVLTTPHVAADSSESENRASRMVAEDVVRILTGKPGIHLAA